MQRVCRRRGKCMRARRSHSDDLQRSRRAVCAQHSCRTRTTFLFLRLRAAHASRTPQCRLMRRKLLIYSTCVEALHFQPLARVATQRYQLAITSIWWLQLCSVSERATNATRHTFCKAVGSGAASCPVCSDRARISASPRAISSSSAESTHNSYIQLLAVGASQDSLRNVLH